MSNSEKPNFFKRLFISNSSPVEETVTLKSKIGKIHPIAVVTKHGFYLKEDSIDFSRLAELAQKEKDALATTVEG